METAMYVAKVIRRSMDWLYKAPVTAAVAFAALTIAAMPPVGDALAFDRGAILGGEFWRLATCHATHWSAEHLQWDVLMFVVLGTLCEYRCPTRMRICLAAGAAAVTVVVLAFFPEVGRYRGLSGIDTALFVLLAIDTLQESWRDKQFMPAMITCGLFLGFIAKTAFEAFAGKTVFVDEHAAGFVPLVWDHVAGAAIGALLAFAPHAKMRRFYGAPRAFWSEKAFIRSNN
jgi:rhomboid family GlyGly-CTERM serine protease